VTSFLQKTGPVFAAGFGLALIIYGMSYPRTDVLSIPGSIIFGSAIIAAQLAKLANQDSEKSS